MDLIGQLSQQLGVNGTQAQGVAGSLLKLVQGTVKEKLGPDAADQLGRAVPEMDTWQRSSTPAASTPGPQEGGLMGALGGLMGGQEGGAGGMLSALGGAAAQAGEVAAVVSLLGRFNIDASKATLVAPLLLDFLKSRLDPGLVGKILAVVPMLAGAGGGGPGSGGGGLGGMLGGLMGGGR
ncbi:DUF2780 domain-containing protein [Pyxidicoccus xibeiensis]|uniref:DUF2780 domain-containing protein n=1 Tax=Pyxidicoccus xibeiensis TaxID=2906759 RepID=UPI0020A780C6|nr:DUF2780 domain-containing protein [Pyxidicoccus xibeiensis]MCP3144178.1 DUF2780 domain-containing protein [Pyxidicoccus xibeiensis]